MLGWQQEIIDGSRKGCDNAELLAEMDGKMKRMAPMHTWQAPAGTLVGRQLWPHCP